MSSWHQGPVLFDVKAQQYACGIDELWCRHQDVVLAQVGSGRAARRRSVVRSLRRGDPADDGGEPGRAALERASRRQGSRL